MTDLKELGDKIADLQSHAIDGIFIKPQVSFVLHADIDKWLETLNRIAGELRAIHGRLENEQ